MERTKVVIGVPSGGDWKAQFALSLVQLILYSVGKGIDVCVQNVRGSILPKNREMIGRGALDNEADYLFFVDSDMTFPPNALERLLAHRQDIVACNCATKATPSGPTARDKVEGDPQGIGIYTHPMARGLEKVWRIGTGVMLIKTQVFKTIPQPWFPITWNDTLKEHVGEDWGFCAKAEKCGFDLWIDHDLSKEIGHIGSFTYDHDWVLFTNPEIAAQAAACMEGDK